MLSGAPGWIWAPPRAHGEVGGGGGVKEDKGEVDLPGTGWSLPLVVPEAEAGWCLHCCQAQGHSKPCSQGWVGLGPKWAQ